MLDFTYYIPTKIHFGKGKVEKLKEEIKGLGNNVLLVYGGGSIKKTGIYDDVLKQLSGLNVYELSGVKPNPRIEKVREGVDICKKNNIDFVIAIGGGSSIDSAKAICAAARNDNDAWSIIEKPTLIKEVLPLFCVLTIAATGSEMDDIGVITNLELKAKQGFSHPSLFPKASVLDPTYTFSVPKKQTASGIADIMSHTLETYFNDADEGYIANQLSVAILKTCIKYGKVLDENPSNYEARSNIMWASSLSINGLNTCGVKKKWSCHAMQHILGAYYDCIHGEALSILTISWMKYVLSENTLDKFVSYGIDVWNIDSSLTKETIANEAINKTRNFFLSLGLAENLTAIGVDKNQLEELVQGAVDAKGGKIEGYITLEKDDVLKIYQDCI